MTIRFLRNKVVEVTTLPDGSLAVSWRLTDDLLKAEVKTTGGFMIAAHPFRGFKTFGIGRLQMTVEQACKRKVFEFVDAIEVGNGKLSPDENDLARKVAEKLDLPGTAGSDAHRVNEVGKWFTVFEKEILDENQLVEELHAGRFRAVKDDG